MKQLEVKDPFIAESYSHRKVMEAAQKFTLQGDFLLLPFGPGFRRPACLRVKDEQDVKSLRQAGGYVFADEDVLMYSSEDTAHTRLRELFGLIETMATAVVA